MIASVNLTIAVIIWLLVLGIGWSHYRERGFSSKTALLGLVVIALASVTLLTSMPAPLGLGEHVEWFRFVAAVFRGIALVLLLAYAWYRWDEQ